jgi:hypothetical protein
MSSSEVRFETAVMPDWNRHEADQIDYADWRQIVELGKLSELTPRARHTEET